MSQWESTAERVAGERTVVCRVGTWNLHEAVSADPGGDKMCNINDVAQLVDEYQLDVLALQEVDLGSGESSAVLDVLCAKTRLRFQEKHVLSPSSFTPGAQAGLAIASRFSIVSRTSEMFENPISEFRENGVQLSSHAKGVLVCTIDLGGFVAAVGSFHAFPFYKFDKPAEDPVFAPTWQSLSRLLGTFRDVPLVFCGDFNTPQRDLLLDVCPMPLQRAVGDTPTYRGLAADDILVSGQIEQGESAAVVPNFSDHKLCVVELVIPQP